MERAILPRLMSASTTHQPAAADGTYGLILAAAAILLITMGARQTSGLFLLPITQSTGVSIVAFSFALAVGQFVFAPAVQFIIGAAGWASAMFATAFAALLTIPLVLPLMRSASSAVSSAAAAKAVPHISLSAQLRDALRNRSYLYLHAGFFTCGFHIAFLVTHFPSELQLCGLTAQVAANSLALIGLFNVVGSLGIGWLGQRYRMKYLLAWIYASRAAMIAIYVVMPKTALNIYIFAAALGVTWLATVPPTAGLVGKLFGTRYLATLFGLTLLSHQIGGFLGAWLGGVVLSRTDSYQWMWCMDIALALMAAIVNLPIREQRLRALSAASPA